ncbi:hypothetical protein V1477_010261 [Vespula maculifrons]|uniref:Uncharacterized protein n=1 Tax=Vespula maculifrons TaxID=7453 RepID=A0ABD2C840_VESMC
MGKFGNKLSVSHLEDFRINAVYHLSFKAYVTLATGMDKIRTTNKRETLSPPCVYHVGQMLGMLILGNLGLIVINTNNSNDMK